MREAIIKISVPTYKKEQGKIQMTFHVKGMIKILEGQIASLMSTDKMLTKPKTGTRYEEAIFLLGELKKFYLADEAGVEEMPELEK